MACIYKSLAGSGLFTPTILTYISAIKSKCSQFGIPLLPWSYPRVNIIPRSCSRTIMCRPDPKQVLTPQTFTQLIQLVNLLPPTIPHYSHHYHVSVPTNPTPRQIWVWASYYVFCIVTV